jgi:integrase
MPIYKSKKSTKDGRSYFFKVFYKDAFYNDKQYVSKKYLTKTEAKDEERKFLNSLKEEKKKPSKMTIGDLWDKWFEYQQDKVRISTKRGYVHTKKYVENMFNIKCTEFNQFHFEEWKKYMNTTKLNNVSKNDKLKVFRAILNFGIKHYDFHNFHKAMMMMTKFEDPGAVTQEHLIYTPEEFELFLKAEDKPRYRILWLTLYYCGLRIGEARGLQWRDIDWDSKTIWINKQVQSIDNFSSSYFVCDLKTKSSNRKLTMCNALYDELRAYYDSCRHYTNFSDDFYCFGKELGSVPLVYANARRRKNVIAERAGVKQIRLHDFRHSCASLLIHSGAPIPMVSKYMGHASVNETLHTYTHMLGSDLQGISDIINNLNEKN